MVAKPLNNNVFSFFSVSVLPVGYWGFSLLSFLKERPFRSKLKINEWLVIR